MKTLNNNKNKADIAIGVVLKFKVHGTEQAILQGAKGRFSWTIEKNPLGKQTAHGWKGYIVKQNNKVAFKCNWLRDFKPAIRHLEVTFSGNSEVSSEFYDICRTGDIYQLNIKLFSEDTIATLEEAINHKVALLGDIPRRKESKHDRIKRLARAKKVLAKKQALGIL